jgi:hypothetical protein
MRSGSPVVRRCQALQCHDAIGVTRSGQGIEQHLPNPAENGRVRTHPDCQGENDDSRQPRIPPKLANREADIRKDGFKRGPLPDFAPAFFHARQVAELVPGSRRSIFLCHAGRNELTDPLVQVRANLLREVVIHLSP